ncbi:hypothetical protein BH10PSE16_BH10PSE16_04260 [soil metagenome]
MNISTTIGALKHALQNVLKAIHTKQITAEFCNGQLHIHACANGAHAKALVPSTGTLPNLVFQLTAKLVLNIINNCATETKCSISQDKEDLRLSFGGARIKLTRYTEKEVDFFKWNSKDEHNEAIGHFESQNLRKAIMSVSRFYSDDDQRYQLRGVYFQSIQGRLVLAATNGTRLAEKITNLVVRDFRPMIIGGEYVEALVSIIKNDEEDVEISIRGGNDATAVIFSTRNFSIKCPLIGGAYPSYRSIIPASDHHVQVNAAALIAALDRMEAVSGNFVHLNFSNEIVTVETPDNDSSEQIQAEGDDFTLSLAIQPKLLAISLAAVTTEKVLIAVCLANGNTSFLTIKNTEIQDGWLALVSPIKMPKN